MIATWGFSRFMAEEKSQGEVEYLLLAAGVTFAAMIIIAFYLRATRETAEVLNRSVTNTTTAIHNRVTNEVKQ